MAHQITKAFIKSNPAGVWVKSLEGDLLFIPEAVLEPLYKAAKQAEFGAQEWERKYPESPVRVRPDSITSSFTIGVQNLYVHFDQARLGNLSGDAKVLVECYRNHTCVTAQLGFTWQDLVPFEYGVWYDDFDAHDKEYDYLGDEFPDMLEGESV